MASAKPVQTITDSVPIPIVESSGAQLIFVIALGVGVIHLLTNSRYGFHRDELQFLSDARHLDWGFVAYPPFTPFVERIGLGMFGLSLVGLRLFSLIAQSIAIVITALMARCLGGGKLAQTMAALSVGLSPLSMFEGTEFQYTTFDYLWWVLIAYFIIRLLKSQDPRWWVPGGAVTGLGLMTKYSILFYIAGILGGLLFTRERRYLVSKWFWLGAVVATLIILPNVLWQVRHDLISYHFLHHIHVRDVGEGRASRFIPDQFRICTNLGSAPLWIAGLISFFRDRRYRLLAWMYVIPLALFMIGKGRGYYLAGAYPMLIAMGAVTAARWLESLRKPWRRTLETALCAGVVAYGLYIAAIVIPFAARGPLRSFALRNNGDLREEIGWDELVRTVAGIRDSLSTTRLQSYGVLVGNYGEQGAIEMLGAKYHLPVPISGTNSAWFRGYPAPPPRTLIVVGLSREYVDRMLTGCTLAGHNGNSEGVHNEESDDHVDIFLCGAPRVPWPEFWKRYQSFG